MASLFLEVYSLHLMIYNQATIVKTRHITKVLEIMRSSFSRYVWYNNIHIILSHFWQNNV